MAGSDGGPGARRSCNRCWRETVDRATRQAVAALWQGADGWSDPTRALEQLAASLGLLDPAARELVELCSRPRDRIVLPDFAWLADEKTPAVERCNLRLLLGRWLVQEKLIDEAQEQLGSLQVDQVADPASLLFYQAVVFHNTLQKKPGLETIARLLEREKEIPRRYASVAKLMEADLSPLKDDSLDHIARRMGDVRRRLDLGRAGPKVREVEDGVIKSLDKLIKEMEDKAAAAAAAMAAAGAQGNIRSSLARAGQHAARGQRTGQRHQERHRPRERLG